MQNDSMFNNNFFEINYSDSLSNFAKELFLELNNKRKEILNFFELKDFRKVKVLLFDNNKEFRDYVLSLRGKEAFLPKYASGVFDQGKMICYINPETIKNKNIFNLKIKQSIHELIHIICEEKIYNERLIWLDEGLALNLSGEYGNLKQEEKFKYFLEEAIFKIKIFPDMNNLNWENFSNDEYNGYDLSYLCVRYLLETKDKNELQKIIKDYNTAYKIGNKILSEAIEYYEKSLEKNGINLR